MVELDKLPLVSQQVLVIVLDCSLLNCLNKGKRSDRLYYTSGAYYKNDKIHKTSLSSQLPSPNSFLTYLSYQIVVNTKLCV